MTTPSNPISLTREDHTKLRLLLATLSPGRRSPALQQLAAELDRAAIFESAMIPAGVVTLESQVEFEDLGTGEVEAYQLTLPDRANVEQRRLSILAPVGTALIGCREGDVVTWTTPGGPRRLQVRRVTPAPAAVPVG